MSQCQLQIIQDGALWQPSVLLDLRSSSVQALLVKHSFVLVHFKTRAYNLFQQPHLISSNQVTLQAMWSMTGLRISICFTSKVSKVWRLWQMIISATFKSDQRSDDLLMNLHHILKHTALTLTVARVGEREWEKEIWSWYFTCTYLGVHKKGMSERERERERERAE